MIRKFGFRALNLGEGENFDFSSGFDDLHSAVYKDIVAGGGYGISDARPAIELVHRLRSLPLSAVDERTHPLCAQVLGGR